MNILLEKKEGKEYPLFKGRDMFWPFLIITMGLMLFGCKDQAPAPQTAPKEALPNIVLLVGDDQGYPYFGFMGADYVKTPNMDALAKSGTLFKNGYVPDNHCRPSLQTLMTGTLPIDYKITADSLLTVKKPNLSEEEIAEFQFHAMKHFNTLPRILAKEGYRSFQGGKWWEFNYQNGGFDEGMTRGWTKEDQKKNDWFLKFMGGEGTELARATMQPVYDFVETNGDKPFFIWFAPELPHYPFDAPQKYYDIYKDKEMTESAKRYYANCTWFDDGVGELMKFLKEKNKFDNTIFVYVNDNGWEQEPYQEFRNDSLRWHNGGDKGKLSLFDQSFRTPILFSWKDRIPSDAENKALIHSADIPATLLDYIGLDVPEDYFGQSYKDVLSNPASHSGRNRLIGNITQMRSEEDMMGKKIEGYWLRDQKWFFKWNKTTGTIGLFDMENDVRNDNDLSGEHPDLVTEFQQAIDNWIAKRAG